MDYNRVHGPPPEAGPVPSYLSTSLFLRDELILTRAKKTRLQDPLTKRRAAGHRQRKHAAELAQTAANAGGKTVQVVSITWRDFLRLVSIASLLAISSTF